MRRSKDRCKVVRLKHHMSRETVAMAHHSRVGSDGIRAIFGSDLALVAAIHSGSRPALIESGWKRIGSSSEGRPLKLKLVRRIKAGHMLLATAAWLAKARENRKNRAGSEFIRRISAMFIFSIRTVVLAVAVSASSLSSAATLSEQSELLCSPEGLMRLIPQFNVKGQFTVPDPNTDLQTFLSAQPSFECH